MGLATVRTIVEAHLGGINVTSDYGRGTTFRIFLPASRLPKAAAPAEAPKAPVALTGDILVVDNDETLLKTTSILLKAMKLGVYVAKTRREALSVTRRHAKELRAILLDAHLGGIDTVRLLGAFRIGAPGVPVMVVSGSAEEELQQLFKAHPYDAFLAKPYTMAELKAALVNLRNSASTAG